jgi:hypothetical protein
VKPRAGWASSPLQVECWPCGREGPARPSSSRPSSPSHPLANGHQGLLLPSKPYPASGRARGGSGCQPGAWTEPFSKEKDKKLKKKKKLIYTKNPIRPGWVDGALLSVCWAPISASFLPGTPPPTPFLELQLSHLPA